MKHTLKPLCAWILLLALLLSACSGPSAPARTSGAAQEEETGGEDEAASRESLMDQKVSVRSTDIPKKAFDRGAERCTALAPDGVTFLMGGGEAPYLYNRETGETLSVVPDGKQTEEALREAALTATVFELMRASSQQPSEDQVEQIRQRLEGLKGKELTSAFCSEFGRVLPLRNVPLYTRDNYLLVSDNSRTLQLLLDCGTGRFTCLPDPAAIPCALQDGRLLYFTRPSSVLTVLTLANGKTAEYEMNDPSVFPDGGRISAAAFLPDGGVCAVLCAYYPDPEKGGDVYLSVLGADSRKPSLLYLDRLLMQREPDRLLTVGGRFAAASGSLASQSQLAAAFLVDLEEGSAARLVSGGNGKIAALSPEDYAAQYPDGPRDAALQPVDAMADDECLLLQALDGSGTLLLYRPDGQDVQTITGKDGFPYILDYSGSHYDSFYAPGMNYEAVYYQLKLR